MPKQFISWAAIALIEKIDPAIRVGLCPCLGNNGSPDEVFTLDDAQTLKAFADQTPWICSLHFWSINHDSARPRRNRTASTTSGTNTTSSTTVATANPRQPWAFANLFKTFTTAQ